MRRALIVLLALLLPTASAQINQADPFTLDLPYSDVQSGELLIANGKADVDLDGATGTFVFFQPEGLEIEGLSKVCWTDGSQAPTCSSGTVAIQVGLGAGVAMRLPAPSDSTFQAPFALGLFADFKGEEDAQSLSIDKSLLAPNVDGTLEFTAIRTIPPQAQHFTLGGSGAGPRNDVGQLVTLEDGASVRITGDQPTTLSGAGQIMTFEGSPAIDRFQAGSPMLPFDGDATATFRVAAADDAREGLDFERLSQLFGDLDAANKDEGGNDASDTDASSGLGGAQDVLSEVLNGALVRFPASGEGEEDDIPLDKIVIYLYERASVEQRGGELRWTGLAAFQFKEGGLANAGDMELLGFTINIPAGDSEVPMPVKLPWWGWAIWGLAIALLVVNLLLNPPKKHETFDRFKWIGWVAGILALGLVFFLWDLEVKSVWGTSALSTQAEGNALYVTYAVQFVTLTMVLGLLKAPLGMALRGLLRLSKLGSFMGLGGPVSTIAAYLLGAILLLPLLDLILRGVLGSLGG